MSKAGRQLLAVPLSLVLGARLPPEIASTYSATGTVPASLSLTIPGSQSHHHFPSPYLALLLVHMVRLYTLSPGNYVMVIVGFILSFAFCFHVTMCLLCFLPLNMIRLL